MNTILSQIVLWLCVLFPIALFVAYWIGRAHGRKEAWEQFRRHHHTAAKYRQQAETERLQRKHNAN